MDLSKYSFLRFDESQLAQKTKDWLSIRSMTKEARLRVWDDCKNHVNSLKANYGEIIEKALEDKRAIKFKESNKWELYEIEYYVKGFDVVLQVHKSKTSASDKACYIAINDHNGIAYIRDLINQKLL